MALHRTAAHPSYSACNQQGDQVRICSKRFGDFIGSVWYEVSGQSNDAFLQFLHVL